jgi:hypothetical protein
MIPAVHLGWLAGQPRLVLAAMVLMTGLVAHPDAHASLPARDPVRAEALFDQAKQQLKAGDWQAGCALFRQSLELDPAVSTQAKVARCYEQEGKPLAAWHAYQQALKLTQANRLTDKRRQELESYIRAAIAQLEPRVPRLRIRVDPAPPGLEVSNDGRVLAIEALGDPVAVDPGQHEVVARAPGYREARVTVNAAEGAVTAAELKLVAEPLLEAPQAAGSGTVPPPRQRPMAPGGAGSPRAPDGRSQRSVAWVVGGAGLLALVGAGYFGLRTLILVNDSNAYCGSDNLCRADGIELRRRAQVAQTSGLILAGVGAAALGVGVTLFVTSPTRDGPASPAVSVRIAPLFWPVAASARGIW